MKVAGQRWRAVTGLDAPVKGQIPMNVTENPLKSNLPVSPADRRSRSSKARASHAARLIQTHLEMLAAQRIGLPILGLEIALGELRQIRGAQ